MAGVFEIVERMSYKDDDGHFLYKGVCKECGFERIARLYDLRYTKMCTHIRIDGQVGFNRTNWENERIECIFSGMKKRCYDQNSKDFQWYGKKGIKICDEWMNNPKLFEVWSIENGYNDELTIDRLDSTKDYSPDNCRWVTKSNNSRYKSTTSLINVNGVTHSGKEWSEILGLGVNTINKYVRKYGLENTIKFIDQYLKNPGLKLIGTQSYYELYMEA